MNTQANSIGPGKAERLVLFLGITVATLLAIPSLEGHLRVAAAISVTVFLISLAATTTAVRGRWLTVDTAFVGLFGLFHTGLLVPIALGVPVFALNPGDAAWVFGPH